MAEVQFTDVTPQAALDALDLRTQNPLPTFSWLDLWQQQHSQAFTVAKSAGFDILGDVQKAFDDAIANGETFEQFRDALTPLLQEKGWWGRVPVLDPATGQMVDAQLGSPERLRIIYDTNMRTSYAAGRWAQIQQNKADQPWLMYLHGASVHPRLQHLAWNHTCLPADDPFWDTHYPPNGWNCSCIAVPLSQGQVDRMDGAGLLSFDRPAISWRDWLNPRTGATERVPEGIDPGFGYNVGKAFLQAIGAGL